MPAVSIQAAIHSTRSVGWLRSENAVIAPLAHNTATTSPPTR